MSHHILVVEDDAVTREKLTGYFEREGYRVTAVENGQEMRAVLAAQEVALVNLVFVAQTLSSFPGCTE
jgi:two-component system torCAD operon response regulator TorR